MHDQLADGRPFRVLTVVDQRSRLSPVLSPALSIRSVDVARVLDAAIGAGPVPRSITVDQGSECMSRALEEWAYQRGVQLDFTRPGNPADNMHIEAFNGRLRDECLTVHQFQSVADARQKTEPWRRDHNHARPHSSLGHLTPYKFLTQRQDEPIGEAAFL